MKKLMIAAAAAAVGLTSFGELCVEDVAADSCAVYNIKFTFKTLAAKRQSCPATWLIDDDFDGVWSRVDRANVTIGDTTVVAGGPHDQTVRPRLRAARRNLWWADNATRTFDGILWQCRASCFEGTAFEPVARRGGYRPGRINYALWEARSRRVISFPVLRYYTRRDKSTYGWWTRNAGNQFRFLGRYGQNAQKVAAYWTPSVMRGWIEAAGFGTFDARNKRMSSVTGNAVGMIAPLNTTLDQCGNDANFFVQVGLMCEDFVQWCCDGCYVGVELVPASGTWSLRYNASLSTGKKSLAKILPDYTVFGPAVFGSAGFERIRAYLNARLYNVRLESNGIFYAPRFLPKSYLVDEDTGKPKVEDDTYEEEDYLNDLAIDAEKAMLLELFSDIYPAGGYVESQYAVRNFFTTDSGEVAYVVGLQDVKVVAGVDEDGKPDGTILVKDLDGNTLGTYTPGEDGAAGTYESEDETVTVVMPNEEGKYIWKDSKDYAIDVFWSTALDWLWSYSSILDKAEKCYPDGMYINDEGKLVPYEGGEEEEEEEENP